jgi:predicted nucleotidyltransferase
MVGTFSRTVIGCAGRLVGLSDMLQLIEMRRGDIAELCRQFHVNRLDVFGSAARGSDFDPARSDVDLLVTYRPGMAAYQDLRDALEALLGRPVDLVMEAAVENPFIRAGIERSRQAIYGA